MANLSFHGATGIVTGSRFILRLHGRKLLIDCGLFQGRKEDRLKNWQPFPVAPQEIDEVLLTHAHIDHTGYLPRFCRDGFSGRIRCTYPTYDLCEIMLKDGAHIQEEDAYWANKKGFSKHSPALPLFTVEDAKRALGLFSPMYYGEELSFDDRFRVKFRDAGHILGSAFIDVKTTDADRTRKIVFSGDLGRPDRPILRNPVQAFNVDYLVLESTYGNRLHPDISQYEELAGIINEAADRGGGLIIPSFAVERTQEILYVIRELEEDKKIPILPVYVDSPMALDATEIFERRIADQDLASRVETLRGKRVFNPEKLQFCDTIDQSKAINEPKSQAIIISSSGMATAGRILHHLRKRLRHPQNTILFVGYQAVGTRGRAILDGASSVKIHGKEIPVKARIESFSGFSGHADYNEILAWLMGFNKPPERTFIVHGEPEASASLADRIKSRFGWDVVVPEAGESYDLDL
jgi:metallo-beta-lactamase family protein